MSENKICDEQQLTTLSLQEAIVRESIPFDGNVELNEFARRVAAQFADGTMSPSVLTASVALMDFLGLFAVGTLLYWFGTEFNLTGLYILVAMFGGLLTVVINSVSDSYLIPTFKNMFGSILSSVTGMGTALLFVAAAVYFFAGSTQYPFGWLFGWFGLSALLMAFSRVLVCDYVEKLSELGRMKRRAVIVGGGTAAAEVIQALENNASTDIQICGIFDDRKDLRSPEKVAGYDKLGTISELLSFARKARVDMLIVTLPLRAERRILQLLKRLWVLPVDIRLSAHSDKLDFRPRNLTYEGSLPFVDIFHRPIANWSSIAKRIFDLIVASSALVVLSPIMLLTAIAIKLDSDGPVFFTQKREGFNNEEIEIYKFRSLHTDLEDRSGTNVVTKGDARVTKVGRFIRRTSIDELPQLVNVLQGRLSVVGPRPHVANAHTDNRLWAEVVDSYIARHKVKPGVTGWAQITGWRGEVDTEEKLKGRVDADLYYIENWSLMFDLKILALTPFRLLNTENAY